MTVFYEPELAEDAKNALDHRVRVEATRGLGVGSPFRALVIEILEDTLF